MTLSADLFILWLLAVAFLAFVIIEIGGLTVPGWHTVSYLAHHYPPLKYALLGTVALFFAWLAWHLNQPIPK